MAACVAALPRCTGGGVGRRCSGSCWRSSSTRPWAAVNGDEGPHRGAAAAGASCSNSEDAWAAKLHRGLSGGGLAATFAVGHLVCSASLRAPWSFCRLLGVRLGRSPRAARLSRLSVPGACRPQGRAVSHRHHAMIDTAPPSALPAGGPAPKRSKRSLSFCRCSWCLVVFCGFSALFPTLLGLF